MTGVGTMGIGLQEHGTKIGGDFMEEKVWENVKNAIVKEGQELSFYLNGEEWWISRLHDEEKSYLLTAPNSDTQFFKTAEELFEKGIVNGKTFIEQVPFFFIYLF